MAKTKGRYVDVCRAYMRLIQHQIMVEPTEAYAFVREERSKIFSHVAAYIHRSLYPRYFRTYNLAQGFFH
ncbi:MAG: hypothetical protein P4M11_03555 [Candidatus Pacebacteria bacterium]|nr:hypothetical protein [Candidatus Paceibacterota bacterium]